MKTKLTKTEIIKILERHKCILLFTTENRRIHYQDDIGYKYSIDKYNLKRTSNLTFQKFSQNSEYLYYNLTLLFSQNNPFNTQIILDSFKSSSSKTTQFICGRCHKKFSSSIENIKTAKYKVCNECARNLQKTRLSSTEKVKQEILKTGHIPLFDKFKGYSKRVLVQNAEGYIGLVKYATLLQGGSITPFGIHNPYALDNLREYCNKHNLDCIIPEQKYKGWDNDLEVVCGCGKKYITTTTHFIHENKIQCNDCSNRQSKLEKVVELFLKSEGINYIREYRFEDCRSINTLPFDFYLSEYNMCIEVDGEQHYLPVEFGGISKERAIVNFAQTQERDKIKTDYCKNNNIQLIRLKYDEVHNKSFEQKLMSIIIH